MQGQCQGKYVCLVGLAGNVSRVQIPQAFMSLGRRLYEQADIRGSAIMRCSQPSGCHYLTATSHDSVQCCQKIPSTDQPGSRQNLVYTIRSVRTTSALFGPSQDN
jgi:hypothetical protein